jgi:alkanesulfonate monooxygenase SsuD/methylene tetrahydromethanopterin reductase-like flavin-dependent oxidoreductase (luciferase family)
MDVSVLIHAQRLSRPELRSVASDADAAGFSAVWSVEVNSDSTIFCHEMASVCERVVVGGSVAIRWKRHPMQFAEAAAAFDHLYPGRFAIGLGTAAWVEDEAEGWMQPRDHSVGRMSEYIDVLRAALSGEAVDYAGDYYQVKGQLDFGPGRGVPIRLAAGGPQLCRLGGRKADAVIIEFGTRDFLATRVDAVREGADKANRSIDEVTINQVAMSAVGGDRDEARNILRRYLVEWALGDEYYRKILAECGFAEVAEEVGRLVAAGDIKGAQSALPSEVVDAISIPLAEDDGIEEIESRVAAVRADGVDDVTLYHCPGSDDWAAEYGRLCQLVRTASA